MNEAVPDRHILCFLREGIWTQYLGTILYVLPIFRACKTCKLFKQKKFYTSQHVIPNSWYTKNVPFIPYYKVNKKYNTF